MSSVVHRIVMWLIALAIPVQGMAAVVMLPCAPAHAPAHAPAQTSAVAVSSDHLSGDHLAGPQSATAQGHAMHHGAVAESAAGSGPNDAGEPGEPGHAGHGMLKCCSAAFSMAAPMASGQTAQVRQSEPAPLHPVAQRYRGVTPDGLDRPPKLILV